MHPRAKRGHETRGTAADGDCAAVDGPGDGPDGASKAAMGGAVLCITGDVTGRVAEVRGLCGQLPVDIAVDGANGTETGVTGDVGVATGVGAKPNEGHTTCPEGQDGRWIRDRREWLKAHEEVGGAGVE